MELIIIVAGEFWNTLREMAPYLLFGFLVAGILSVYISPEFVERHLGGSGILSVLKASLLGVPLPLCSCGVIPVGASLRRSGASRGATVAFLLSTPQTGVDSIMVTLSLLGPVFAIFRPFAALVTGIMGGVFTILFGEADEVPEIRAKKEKKKKECTGNCCVPKQDGNKMVEALRYGFVTLPRDIGLSIFVGLAIAGAIAAFVPSDFLGRTIGSGIAPMLIMMLMGIPLYVCATASVPIAVAMIAKGISPGAALVFLMTGPVTNAAAIVTIWKVLGKRTAIVYLVTVALCALAAGFLLDHTFTVLHASPEHAGHGFLPDVFKTISAIGLLGVLLVSNVIKRPYGSDAVKAADAAGTAVRLAIRGMTCSHCVKTVTRTLEGITGVVSVDVSLERGDAIIAGEGADPAALIKAVEELGYKAEETKE